MASLRLIFAGSGEFGLPTLRALQAAGHSLIQVISQPDRPAGRGRKLTPTPIAQFAIDHALPLLRTANLNVEALPDADVMVVIAFGQKIGPAAVARPRLGSVNLHASRLPKYRGAAPIHHAILNGETISGNSIIRLAERMDAGAVLAQSEVTIGELETTGELHNRLAEEGAPLMLQTLDALAAGTARQTPQDESQATLAPKLDRNAARLDFTQPAEVLARRIRGLYPWPGCRVRLVEAGGTELGRLTLVRGRAVAGSSAALSGQLTPAGLIAAGHDTALEIVEVQPEGKRPMPLGAYRNGRLWPAGATIASII
jgi:methionyl-tRNA formyltransferase